MPPREAPVFILGVHRSGTTWLTRSLAARGRCAPFSVRDLLARVEDRPHSYDSARDRLRAAGVFTRPGDGLAVEPEGSEEYGYALTLTSDTSRTTAENLPVLRDLIAGLVAEHPGHTPLLRNPWDYAATHKLAAWFPDARFVFVHRDPIATVGSAVEMFRDFWTAPHPYGVLMSPRYRRSWASRWQRTLFQAAAHRPRLVARIIASGTAMAHRAHLRDAAVLAPHRALHVRYSDLLSDPTQRIDDLLRQLDIPIVGDVLADAAPRTAPDRPWMDAVTPALLRATRRYRQERALTDVVD